MEHSGLSELEGSLHLVHMVVIKGFPMGKMMETKEGRVGMENCSAIFLEDAEDLLVFSNITLKFLNIIIIAYRVGKL